MFLRDADLLTDDASTVRDWLAWTLDAEAGSADAEFVLETVAEDSDVKAEVFETVSEAAPTDAIFPTNTSGIPISEFAEFVPDPTRVVGCH